MDLVYFNDKSRYNYIATPNRRRSITNFNFAVHIYPLVCIHIYEKQVCRRVLSLEEANAICTHAQTVSGGTAAVHNRPSSFVPLPDTSLIPIRSSSAAAATATDGAEAAINDTAAVAPLSIPTATKVEAAPAAGGGAADEETAVVEEEEGPRVRLASVGLGQHPTSAGNLNDLLSTLFKEADKEEKVRCGCCGARLERRRCMWEEG